MDKLLLINKPVNWTSFDVVAKIRGKISEQKKSVQDFSKTKVGHSGTLDPFASGLLIILIGKYTKEQASYMNLEKEYVADLVLGKTSTTGDPEGEIKETPKDKYKKPDQKAVENALLLFKGGIIQTPPIFSAIKVNGKRAYQLARKGESVELKKRKIKITQIKLLSYNFPRLKIKIKCSSGTYVRSLAQDIGGSLKTGAYLVELKRTKIGKYSLNNAKKIEEI